MVYKIVRFLCPVVLFGIGAVQFCRELLDHFWYGSALRLSVETKFIYLHHWLTISSWWLLVAFLPFSLLLMYLWSLFSAEKNILSLKSSSGKPLKIREAAINRFVHDDLLLIPFVKDVRICALAPSGVIALSVRVWITSAGPLDELQTQLLDRIREALQTGLGIGEVADIDLKFESVQLTKTQVREKMAGRKPAPESPAIPLPLSSAAPTFSGTRDIDAPVPFDFSSHKDAAASHGDKGLSFPHDSDSLERK